MQKVLRIAGFVVIISLIGAAIIASTTAKPSNADKVWDIATTEGNIEAKNYFIVYSDIACPYCVAFENAIFEHEEEFKKYIADNDILFEVRTSDFLYEYGTSNPISSRYSAEGTYCAKSEGKFWDYYRKAITTVWNDYFKKYGKSAFVELNALDENYWIGLGKEVGLGDEFENCMKNDESVKEVKDVAAKMIRTASGLPTFRFNNYSPQSSFELSWGWEYVLMYFDAGLNS